MTNIIYYDNCPFYTPKAYELLLDLAENKGKVTLRKYFNTFRDEFNSFVHANEALRNLDTKLYLSAEIIIAIELGKNLKMLRERYGYKGELYVSTGANGFDIIYANKDMTKVSLLEAKCVGGHYKEYSRGNIVRPLLEDGTYLSTKTCWKYHLTKKDSPDACFQDLLAEFDTMDAVHGTLVMADGIYPRMAELFFVPGPYMQKLLEMNRNKQNLIQITPSTFYTQHKDYVVALHA